MAEALVAVLAAVIVAALVGSIARAVLVAALDGSPADLAALAPLAELARSVRRPPRWGGARVVVALALLLLAAAARTVELVVGNAAALAVLAAAQVVVVVAVRIVDRRPGTLAISVAAVLALAAPGVAAGSGRLADIAAAQSGLWFAVQAPAAFLVAFAVAGPRVRGDGIIVAVGRWLALASGEAAVATLFLGGHRPPGSALTLAAVVLVLVVVTGETLAPRLARPAVVGWVAAGLAVVQLVVVAALTTLPG